MIAMTMTPCRVAIVGWNEAESLKMKALVDEILRQINGGKDSATEIPFLAEVNCVEKKNEAAPYLAVFGDQEGGNAVAAELCAKLGVYVEFHPITLYSPPQD